MGGIGEMDGPASGRTARLSLVRRLLTEVVAVLVLFTAAGFGAGWLWEKLWTPETGVVYQDRAADGGIVLKWLGGYRVTGDLLTADYQAKRSEFDAVAIYVLIGILAALVLGVLCALVARRAELVTLGAVLVGSALAAFIAYRFGVHLGPPDPDVLAKTSDPGTVLPSALSIAGKSPYVVWPLGALIGLMVTYFLTAGGDDHQRRDVTDPDWLSIGPSSSALPPPPSATPPSGSMPPPS